MQPLGMSLLLAYLLHSSLASDYYDYYEQSMDEPDSPPKPDMEQKLRSASSVDELMSLIYPSYWAALKCRSKLSAAKLSQRPRLHQLRPPAETEPTYAAAYLNLDVLKSIESEWRKTQCMPREVCVDVSREFGAATNIFYKPPCVSVYRCGGCCHSEDKQCRNISTGYLSKTLFEITVPISQGTKPVTISVANHTQCSCLSKLDVYKQVHSIIRRSLPECPVANKTCLPGQAWSSRLCQCGPAASVHRDPPLPPAPPSGPPQHLDIFSADVCGSDKELDVETCQCVCRRKDHTHDCGPNYYLDRNTCQCVCSVPPAPSCPVNHLFNRDTCQCACVRTCPRNQPLNKTKCSCECTESPNKCFLKGRRFHAATCSCWSRSPPPARGAVHPRQVTIYYGDRQSLTPTCSLESPVNLTRGRTQRTTKTVVVSDLPARSEGEGVSQACLSARKCVAAYRPTGGGWTNGATVKAAQEKSSPSQQTCWLRVSRSAVMAAKHVELDEDVEAGVTGV